MIEIATRLIEYAYRIIQELVRDGRITDANLILFAKFAEDRAKTIQGEVDRIKSRDWDIVKRGSDDDPRLS